MRILKEEITKIAFLLSLVVPISPVCFAASPSPEELVNDFRTAYETGTVEAFRALYLWDNVSADMVALTEETIKSGFLALPLASIGIEPLDENRKTEFIVNGFKYYPNVSLAGYLKLDHNTDGQTGTTSIPFGTHDGRYYLANTIKEKVEGAPVQQQYNVSVFGMPAGAEGIAFSGQIQFLSNGQPVTEEFSGTNNISKSFWADSLTGCVIKRLSGEGELDLTIYEAGSQIFRSENVTSNDDIVFKKEERP